jgi:hypothetical protein
MLRLTHRAFTLLVCMAAFCGLLCAQTGKTITVRMLDGKTGKLITASNFLVRVDHEPTVHADWVVQNEDGTGKLTLPRSASLLSIQATYQSSMAIYVNCDSASEKENPVGRWYSIAEILSLGVTAPNGCVKPAEDAKLKPLAIPTPAAKPGEFVFFVRKQNWREQMQEDEFSH